MKLIQKHKHHIVPRHMGGTDDASNLVEVTVEEHAALHKQLWEDLKDKRDFIAWKTLSGQMSNYDAIQEARRLPKTEQHKKKLSLASKKFAQDNPGKTGRPKGSKNKKPYSEEILQKRRGANHPMFGVDRSGTKNPMFGKKRPDVSERNKTAMYNRGGRPKGSKNK